MGWIRVWRRRRGSWRERGRRRWRRRECYWSVRLGYSSWRTCYPVWILIRTCWPWNTRHDWIAKEKNRGRNGEVGFLFNSSGDCMSSNDLHYLCDTCSNDTPQLYTVLPEKRTDRIGQAMMGSTHVYDIAAATAATTTQKSTVHFLLILEQLENFL